MHLGLVVRPTHSATGCINVWLQMKKSSVPQRLALFWQDASPVACIPIVFIHHSGDLQRWHACYFSIDRFSLSAMQPGRGTAE